jgi:AcrR family transcriptional regulator
MTQMSEVRQRSPRLPIEVRREQVLDAALRIIIKSGYAAASMEAIAREAELAKPRVYTAYPGRGPLLKALLEREEGRAFALLAEAMPALTDDATFSGVLTAATTNLLKGVAHEPDSWRLLVLAADDTPTEVRDHVRTGREFALNRLRALVEWGQSQQAGSGNPDIELLAQILLAIGEQAVRLVLTQPDEFTPERYEQFIPTVLKLLG